MKAILATLCLLALAACTDDDNATRVLQQSGYTQIEITGYRPFMKGKDDTYSTGFKATSPTGARVSGAVTGGPFKGNTIRLD